MRCIKSMMVEACVGIELGKENCRNADIERTLEQWFEMKYEGFTS